MKHDILFLDIDASMLLLIPGILVTLFVVYSILFLPSIAKYAKKQNDLLQKQNEILEKIFKEK